MLDNVCFTEWRLFLRQRHVPVGMPHCGCHPGGHPHSAITSAPPRGVLVVSGHPDSRHRPPTAGPCEASGLTAGDTLPPALPRPPPALPRPPQHLRTPARSLPAPGAGPASTACRPGPSAPPPAAAAPPGRPAACGASGSWASPPRRAGPGQAAGRRRRRGCRPAAAAGPAPPAPSPPPPPPGRRAACRRRPGRSGKRAPRRARTAGRTGSPCGHSGEQPSALALPTGAAPLPLLSPRHRHLREARAASGRPTAAAAVAAPRRPRPGIAPPPRACAASAAAAAHAQQAVHPPAPCREGRRARGYRGSRRLLGRGAPGAAGRQYSGA